MPSPQPKTKKTRQFRRSPSLVAALGGWTERDEAIVRHVAENRFITSEHLAYLVGGSKQKLQRRLQQLYHHNYLDRPKQQLKLWGTGRKAFVYALGDDGAAHLRGKGSLIVGKSPRYWTKKNLEVGAPHIFHTLTLTSFHVALARACADADLTLTWQRESVALRYHASVRDRRARRAARVPINPDAYFAVTFPSPVAGKKRTRHVMLEVDMATMPNEREHLSLGTSVYKKLRAYWTARKDYAKHLGIPGYIVLVATTTPTRVANLTETARKADDHRKGSDMFWLGTFDPHEDYRHLLDPRWKSPTGKTHALNEH